uniref:Fcf2 domain-containing protein n=1 Tax=Parastrongyloides trichosuri TaxID=131310 RepID=A0A0N4ZH14_PARTI
MVLVKRKSLFENNDVKIAPEINKIMEGAVVGPAIEKEIGKCMKERTGGEKKKERKRTKEQDAGKGWFNMKAPEMTDEIKRDLEAIKMRSTLDPTAHYRKNDSDSLPKYFQIGRVIETKADFYSSRLTNKERKRTIVDELISEQEANKHLRKIMKKSKPSNKK